MQAHRHMRCDRLGKGRRNSILLHADGVPIVLVQTRGDSWPRTRFPQLLNRSATRKRPSPEPPEKKETV